MRSVNANDGEIGVGIIADDVSIGTAAIGENDVDFGSAMNDVAVGEGETVGGDQEP